MSTTGKGFRRFGAVLTGVGILVSVLVVTLMVGDLQEFRNLWESLHWQVLIFMVLLGVVNHGLRYWRWEILLKNVASSDFNFKRSTSVLIFLAGSLLIFTPVRVGEAAKSVYAREFFGIPMATSLPILIAERLVDVVVIALLSSVGLLLLGEPPSLLLSCVILGVTLLVFIIRKPLLEWAARWRITRLWTGSSLRHMLGQAKESLLSLLSARMLGVSFALGICAWIIEVLIYFLGLSAVGVPTDFHLFFLALAVFPLASLAGGLSFLPAGLGVTEGGLTALVILLGGLSQESALLSALLSRAAILGVVVISGIVSVLLLRRVSR